MESFFQKQLAIPRSSYNGPSEEELRAHFSVSKYGDFELTDAVRPSFNLAVTPRRGYRKDTYDEPGTGHSIPVLLIAESKENLLELFYDLCDVLREQSGDSLGAVLEASHEHDGNNHIHHWIEDIDYPVFRSHLIDYEGLLLNDGCTGIVVVAWHIPCEIQFDEHKLLYVYGNDLEPFEDILAVHCVPHDPDIRFIFEAEHAHNSSEDFQNQFNELAITLGADEVLS